MKLLHKIFRFTVILLILALIAGIVYVAMFKEEPVKEEARKQAQHITKKPVPAKPTEVSKKPPAAPASRREVAVIIDDTGGDLGVAKEFLKIKANLTFAVLPFQAHSREAADLIHKAKRETLLHLPMEPVSYPREKPGEGAMFTDMNDEETLLQLKKDIAAVPHIVGVNNHMGSKFMNDEKKLSLIFKELKKQNLFFVDSRTSPDSKAAAAAKKARLNMAERKIFIDNRRDYKEIYNILINVANSDDPSPKIIIGHPYPETARALQDAADVFRKDGISIVPVSRIIKETKTF